MQRLRILHVAANYPDGFFRQPTTQAVRNLLEATSDDFNHHVISISRVMPWEKICSVSKSECDCYSYRGLPALVGASIFLPALAGKILDDLRGQFDVVHAHKLTVEGWVGQLIAQQLALPLVITVRGYTDLRILDTRIDLRWRFRKILESASLVLVPAPWTKAVLASKLRRKSAAEQIERAVLLPNIVDREGKGKLEGVAGVLQSRSKFYTVFRAGQGRAKGYYSILEAAARIKDRLPLNFIDVIGCGESSDEYRVTVQSGLHEHIRFLGRLPNEEVLKRVPGYDGLLLPSRAETFGMSYVEALLCGVPVMYSANTGIDGFFNELDVGARVDANSISSVEHGLIKFLEQSKKIKINVQRALCEGHFDIFKSKTIAEVYKRALRTVALGARDVTGGKSQ